MATKRSLRLLNRLAEDGRTSFTTTDVCSAVWLSPQTTSNLLGRLVVEVWSIEWHEAATFGVPLARLVPKPCGMTSARLLRPRSRAMHTGRLSDSARPPRPTDASGRDRPGCEPVTSPPQDALLASTSSRSRGPSARAGGYRTAAPLVDRNRGEGAARCGRVSALCTRSGAATGGSGDSEDHIRTGRVRPTSRRHSRIPTLGVGCDSSLALSWPQSPASPWYSLIELDRRRAILTAGSTSCVGSRGQIPLRSW